jgi:hypothetical protein
MAHDPDRNAAMHQTFASAGEASVKVLGVYGNAPAHRVYILLEADSADQITKFFDPILEYGHVETEPVVDYTAMMA